MLTKTKLRRALGKVPISVMEGFAFRLVDIKYQQDFLSTIGSLKVGGRYNIRNEFAAFYAADNPITALKELRALIETPAGLKTVESSPRVLFTIQYRLNKAIDLTDSETQNALGTNLQELTGVWRPIQDRGEIPPTQLLGQTVYQLGKIEALKVPSSVDASAYNLVIFSDRLSPESLLRVYDNSGTIQTKIP